MKAPRKIEVVSSLLDIPWSLKSLDSPHPFESPEFYKLCEESKIVGPGTGWNPLYFLIIEENEATGMLAAYIKTDSFGEFIFDWAWADLYQRNGIAYYPKLTCALPFTPVNAPKALAKTESAKKALLDAFADFFEKSDKLSSAHALFINAEESRGLKERGFFERRTIQYHFRNEYSSFEDFLSSLKTRKRKQIKKERKALAESGLEIKILENQFSTDLNARIHQLYLTTIDKRWSQAYLNEDFFQLMAKRFPHSVVVVGAYKEKELAAMAYFIKSDQVLYGRYWGVSPEEEIPYLHFELSYYRGIEYCVEKGLPLFEAGAQGEQKLLRGFRPVEIFSAHKLALPPVHQAIDHHVKTENAYTDSEMKRLESYLPFKKKELDKEDSI